MKISKYKALISHLPVKEQSFTTKRETWKNGNINAVRSPSLIDSFFENETLTISRKDVFDSIDLRTLIFNTFFWGYPRGMRGDNFFEIWKNLEKLAELLKNVKKTSNFSIEDFLEVKEEFNSISGLGISTYSKLLYFLDIKINNNTCLILDQRLITNFKNRVFDEYRILQKINYSKAPEMYFTYLEITNAISLDIETKEENIELFLFMFGNNLKIK